MSLLSWKQFSFLNHSNVWLDVSFNPRGRKSMGFIPVIVIVVQIKSDWVLTLTCLHLMEPYIFQLWWFTVCSMSLHQWIPCCALFLLYTATEWDESSYGLFTFKLVSANYDRLSCRGSSWVLPLAIPIRLFLLWQSVFCENGEDFTASFLWYYW